MARSNVDAAADTHSHTPRHIRPTGSAAERCEKALRSAEPTTRREKAKRSLRKVEQHTLTNCAQHRNNAQRPSNGNRARLARSRFLLRPVLFFATAFIDRPRAHPSKFVGLECQIGTCSELMMVPRDRCPFSELGQKSPLVPGSFFISAAWTRTKKRSSSCPFRVHLLPLLTSTPLADATPLSDQLERQCRTRHKPHPALPRRGSPTTASLLVSPHDRPMPQHPPPDGLYEAWLLYVELQHYEADPDAQHRSPQALLWCHRARPTLLQRLV